MKLLVFQRVNRTVCQWPCNTHAGQVTQGGCVVIAGCGRRAPSRCEPTSPVGCLQTASLLSVWPCLQQPAGPESALPHPYGREAFPVPTLSSSGQQERKSEDPYPSPSPRHHCVVLVVHHQPLAKGPVGRVALLGVKWLVQRCPLCIWLSLCFWSVILALDALVERYIPPLGAHVMRVRSYKWFQFVGGKKWSSEAKICWCFAGGGWRRQWSLCSVSSLWEKVLWSKPQAEHGAPHGHPQPGAASYLPVLPLPCFLSVPAVQTHHNVTSQHRQISCTSHYEQQLMLWASLRGLVIQLGKAEDMEMD